MTKPKIQMVNLSGQPLPEDLKAMILQKITGLKNAETEADMGLDLGGLFSKLNEGAEMVGIESDNTNTVAMTKQEALDIFLSPDVTWKPQVGDLVVLRDEMSCGFGVPQKGEVCVVTQVMDPPLRSHKIQSSLSGMRHNICIGFKQNHDSHMHYMEHTMDSRYFHRLGNIYDGQSD